MLSSGNHRSVVDARSASEEGLEAPKGASRICYFKQIGTGSGQVFDLTRSASSGMYSRAKRRLALRSRASSEEGLEAPKGASSDLLIKQIAFKSGQVSDLTRFASSGIRARLPGRLAQCRRCMSTASTRRLPSSIKNRT